MTEKAKQFYVVSNRGGLASEGYKTATEAQVYADELNRGDEGDDFFFVREDEAGQTPYFR